MSYKSLSACVICILISSSAIANEEIGCSSLIAKRYVMKAAKLGNVSLFHQDNNFVVEQDGIEKHIQPCFVSPVLRNISPVTLSKFLLADGYLKLSELKNDNYSVDYKLDACGRLRGGGPWLGGLTFIACSLATVGATVVAVAVATPAGPAAMAGAGVATVYGGVALTAKATLAATVAPTP